MTGDGEIHDALDLLEAAAMHRAIAEDDIAYAVAICREVGYSWNLIGRVLDMTGEGARKRYNQD